MSMKQILPITLKLNREDDNPYIYYARAGGGDLIQLLQFGLHETKPLYAYGPSVRDHDLIHFVFSGRGAVTLGGRRFSVQSGEMFLIPKNQIAYYQADEAMPWYYAWIGFDGAWGRGVLDEMGMGLTRPVADMRDTARVYSLVSAMRAVMFDELGYIPLLSGALELLSEMLSGPKARAPYDDEPPLFTTGQRMDQRVNDIILYLEKHYTERLSVEAIAEQYGVSRPYISEQFRKRTGKSLKAYITDLRMRHACMLMTDTHLSIHTIAERCGYVDPLFFSRLFRKTYGLSPKAYKEAVEHGKNPIELT